MSRTSHCETKDEEPTPFEELDDADLARLHAEWKNRFIVPNRFPGSSNAMFVEKARRIRAVEAEMTRRGLIGENENT